MPRKCAVPGCTSNYNNQTTYTPAFLFPKDESRRKQWTDAINRKDFVPGSSSVVCLKHFDDRFIIKEDKVTQKDGSVIIIPRKKLSLTDDAYPSIFPNQPQYLTTSLPKERKLPSERRKAMLLREEEKFLQWCEEDQIGSFDQLKSNVQKKLPNFWLLTIEKHSVFIYKVDIFECPEVSVALEVLEDLSVKLYYRKQLLDSKSVLGFILEKENKLNRWTKLETMLSFLNGFELNDMTLNQKVECVTFLLNELLLEDEVPKSKIKFLGDQFASAFLKRQRYSPDIILWSIRLYFSYPAAYMMVRKSGILTLPHQSYLRNLASSMDVSNIKETTNSHYSYLKRKATTIENYEKIVNVLLDEIYINPTLDYKGGDVVGFADNCNQIIAASTVQTFMISSIFSKNKDVVSLIPVKNLTSDQLLKYTLKVLDLIHSCGYVVLTLISDNNRINRNMFSTLCHGNLKTSFTNPNDSSKQIFILFDTPHLMKSVRNNWLNQSVTNQTFFYPDPINLDKINVASMVHLRQIYDAEKTLTVKTAPKLCKKVLFPSSTEKQNVKHALCLFHETTVASLEQNSKTYGLDLLQTKTFIEHLQRWRKIVNCKHPYKGMHSRDQYCDPISTIDHHNVLFLEHFAKWLCKWKELSSLPISQRRELSIPEKGGMLSRETEFALLHTTQTLIEVSKYILLHLKSKYVLLGKLQTDSLEARFGQYRQMCGGNYNVSYRQIIESDKKLKILSLITLLSNQSGEFSVKMLDCTEIESDDKIVETQFREFTEVIRLSDNFEISESTKSVLTFISGYVAHKVCHGLLRKECISMMSLDKALTWEAPQEIHDYLSLIDRGGLKWPTNFTLSIVITAFSVFELLISKAYESKFLKLSNMKGVVIKLAMEKIIITNMICLSMCSCGISSDALIKKGLCVIVNVLLNNYCKMKNDDVLREKNKKRKMSTLKSA